MDVRELDPWSENLTEEQKKAIRELACKDLKYFLTIVKGRTDGLLQEDLRTDIRNHSRMPVQLFRLHGK